MDLLVPENAIRSIDSLGRITLPKGLRKRFQLTEVTQLELYTAEIEGRECIVLALPEDKEARIQSLLEELRALGVAITRG